MRKEQPTFCFRRLQESQACAVRWRLSSGTLGRVMVEERAWDAWDAYAWERAQAPRHRVADSLLAAARTGSSRKGSGAASWWQGQRWGSGILVRSEAAPAGIRRSG